MTAPCAENLSFEKALQALEDTVRALEDGQTGLEDSLGHYEKGIGLLRHCYGLLQNAEQKILLLTGVDAEGKPATSLFEHSAAVEKPGAKPKKSARSTSDG